MSSIPFERYDDEFQSLTDQVKASISKTDDGPINLEFASNLLSQCDDLLKQMSVEARGVEDGTTKSDLLHKVRVCKAQLANLKDDFAKLQTEQERMDLLANDGGSKGVGGGGSNNGKSMAASKQRLLDNQKQLERQNESLENARRIMADTEDVALEITTELGRNRETLESAHGRVREVSGLTNRARRLLQTMNRRAVQQKMALYAVGITICVVVLVVLWNLR